MYKKTVMTAAPIAASTVNVMPRGEARNSNPKKKSMTPRKIMAVPGTAMKNPGELASISRSAAPIAIKTQGRTVGLRSNSNISDILLIGEGR